MLFQICTVMSQVWYLHVIQSKISQERSKVMNFYKSSYQLILRYLYTETVKRRGEISLHKHFNNLKGKWQQTFNSSHLKEIQNQRTEVYYKIFISVLLWEIFSPKSTNCHHLGLIFNLRTYGYGRILIIVSYENKIAWSHLLRITHIHKYPRCRTT